jgi:two-component system, LytTR family, response regulator LytT
MEPEVAGSVLRVAVLEDEWIARNFLVELIEASGLAKVVAAVGVLEDAQHLLSTSSGMDAVFVDINLAGSQDDGLSLVRDWSTRADAPLFVLATALKDHALEAFDLGVSDYITKPFSQLRVTQCLQRLLLKRPPSDSEADRIVARRRRTLVFLSTSDIWAFEASERLALVHSAHGTFEIDLSLSTVELSFGRRFLRVHRNWLVNTAYVRELDRESGESTLLVGAGYAAEDRNVRVPVARDRAQTVRDHLLRSTLGIRRR